MARGAASVLAIVLAVAAVAKLARRQGTGEELGQLGLLAPEVLAWVVPVVELGTAVLLIISPAWGGVAAFALLAAFTVVLVRVLRSGRVVSCNCFGALSRRPVSNLSLVRNGVLLVLAAVAAAA